jgi:hypothetical protein
MKAFLASASVVIVVTATFLVATGALLSTARQAQANPGFAKQTGLGCPSCHTSPPNLNDKGKKFKANGNKL